MVIPGSNSGGGIRGQRQSINAAGPSALTQLSKIGQQASQIVQQYQSQKDHDSLIEAQNKIRNDVNSFKQEELTKEGHDAEGAYKRYEENYKTIVDKYSTGLSDRARKNLGNWADNRFSSEKVQFYKHEHSQRKSLAKTNFNDSLTSIQEEVRMNPFNYQDAAKSVEEATVMAVGSGALKKSEMQAQLTDSQNKLRNYAMQEMYSADKDRAIEGIEGLGFGEGEKAKWLSKYEADKEREKRELKQRNSLERDLLMEKLPGMEAIATEHGDTTPLKAAVVKLRDLGYDKESRKLTKTAELYDKSYPTLQKIKSLPIKDAITEVQKLHVGHEAATADQDMKVRDVARRALDQRIDKYRKDPVSVIHDKAFGETPEDRVSSRIRLQKEQGITLKGGYRALSNAEAHELKNRFEQSSTAEKISLLMEIGDPEKGYGKHKRQVLKEMGIPPAASLAEHFAPGKTQELILAAATSEDPEILNNDKRADYKYQAKSGEMLTMLKDVQEMMPQDVGFNKAAESIQSAIVNAAVMSGDVNKANSLIEDNFTILNDSSIKAYLPKDYDEDDVELHLENKRSSLIQSMTQGQSEFRQKEIARLVSEGVWVNDGDGFILVDKYSGKAFDSYTALEEVERGVSDKVQVSVWNGNSGR